MVNQLLYKAKTYLGIAYPSKVQKIVGLETDEDIERLLQDNFYPNCVSVKSIIDSYVVNQLIENILEAK